MIAKSIQKIKYIYFSPFKIINTFGGDCVRWWLKRRAAAEGIGFASEMGNELGRGGLADVFFDGGVGIGRLYLCESLQCLFRLICAQKIKHLLPFIVDDTHVGG